MDWKNSWCVSIMHILQKVPVYDQSTWSAHSRQSLLWSHLVWVRHGKKTTASCGTRTKGRQILHEFLNSAKLHLEMPYYLPPLLSRKGKNRIKMTSQNYKPLSGRTSSTNGVRSDDSDDETPAPWLLADPIICPCTSALSKTQNITATRNATRIRRAYGEWRISTALYCAVLEISLSFDAASKGDESKQWLPAIQSEIDSRKWTRPGLWSHALKITTFLPPSRYSRAKMHSTKTVHYVSSTRLA